MANHSVLARARRRGAGALAGLASGALLALAVAAPAAADPVSGSTGVDPGVSGSTGVDPGVSGSTDVDPGVSGSTGVDPGVSGSTGADPGVSGSTSDRPDVVEVAAPAGSAYVALGDSYSSGTGTRSYISDGTECLRSTQAYPSLIATANSYSLDFRACSGAVVADVRANQLQALSASTDLVTVSIGGNDAGFTDVITECAQPGWMSDCDAAIDTAQAFVNGTLPSRLSGLYAQIDAAAPNAQVVVVGYPRLFMGEDCNALTWISPEEMTRLNAMADLLNARTASAASAYGFSYANPTSAFVGHAVCDDPEWLNGLSNPIVESYHPNTLGHAQGYAPLVSSVVGTSAAITPAVAAQAATRADEYAAQQAPYAAYDRTIEPRAIDLAPLQAAGDAIARGTAPAE